jgi:dihydrodipicolinate synthase/N-acetylneuraminate lyase
MINGIIPAVVLPMDSLSNPDYDEYKNYLQWVKSAGVTGVAVNADTGEHHPH